MAPRMHAKVQFFCFRPEIHFLQKFIPKNQTGQFKLKVATSAKSNKQNSMVMLTFSVFYPK